MLIAKKQYTHNSDIPIFNRFGLDNLVSIDDLTGYIKPEYFGAKGDGVTNDSDAFIAMSLYYANNTDKTIELSNKTYIIGKQVLGQVHYLTGQNIMTFSGLKNVIINGNGAVLKIEDGLKYGSYDPINGNPFNPTLPFYDTSYKASLGNVIYVENCDNVSISNLTIIGNSENLLLGGEWGDTGRQIEAYGLFLHNNKNVKVYNIVSTKNALDGLVISNVVGSYGLDQKKYLLENITSTLNGRQGLTYIGGNNLTCVNCNFSETGQNGIITSPSAGIDIETEGGNIIENAVFINCIIADNKGVGIVSDGGDSRDLHFLNCKVYGTDQVSLWLKNPAITLTNCLISGGSYNCYSADNESERTRFIGCKFSGDEVYKGKYADFQDSLFDFTGQNPYFENCSFITNNVNVGLPISTSGATYSNCFFKQNGNVSVALTKGTFIGVNTFDIVTGQNDLSGSIFINSVKDLNSKIIGVNISENLSESNSYDALSNLTLRGSNGFVWNNQKIYSCYQVPTSGNYKKGDIVFNNNANIGDPLGWYCTISGTPGTWVSIGLIN